MDAAFYFEKLYPLQDKVLAVVRQLDTGFFLSGGTAASRGYLHHRFSDDLDLFVSDDSRFRLWSERVIRALDAGQEWQITVLLREDRFVRLALSSGEAELKLELINDVPAHIGEVRMDPVLGRLDTAENILANKLTALVDREEPKDLADVWGFCRLCISRSPKPYAERKARPPASLLPTSRECCSARAAPTGSLSAGSPRRRSSATWTT